MEIHTKKPIMKPLSDLTLLDRFLFACAMEDSKIMQLVLQIILGRHIPLLDRAQAEKELRTAPWLRSIRLDVFAVDSEDNVYNAEVQKKNTGNLLKRSRFYQALIDSSLLPPGELDFNQLPASCLIMVTPFDLFGEGRYRYTFQMKCQEAEHIGLEDGAVRIFLNTRGNNPGEDGEELAELLRYFEHTTSDTAAGCRSERVKEIHQRICQTKSSEEIGVRYMQEWEEKMYELREAKQQGLEQGLSKGLSKGIQAFILDNLEESVPRERILAKLQKRFDLSPEQAENHFREVTNAAGQ